MSEQLEFTVALSQRGLKNNHGLQVVIFYFWSSRKANAVLFCDFDQGQIFKFSDDLNQAVLIL
jgi:hypothetical protein